MESNGTPVNDDEILELIKSEILILLTKNEQWISIEAASIGSAASTLTVTSADVTSDANTSNSDINNETILVDIQNSTAFNVLSSTPIIMDANFEYTWTHLDIPWSRIPQSFLQLLETGVKWQNCKSAISEICHTIVHEMRSIKTKIPVMAFKHIANKIVSKYPQTFIEHDIDGVVIGDGTYFLIRKLIDRNNYLNRPHKRGWEDSNPTPLKLKKKKMNSVAGCSHWEQSAEPTEDQSDQEKLKTLNETSDEYYNLLEKTYSDQRIFLNNIESPPSVDEIKEQWPALLQKAGAKWHFRKVTGVDLENLKTSIEEKAENILNYGCQKKLCSSDWDRNMKAKEVLNFLC